MKSDQELRKKSRHDRKRYLPILIMASPEQIKDCSPEGITFIINRLLAAIEGEEGAAKERHWSYDINRHKALKEALEGEKYYLSEVEAENV